MKNKLIMGPAVVLLALGMAQLAPADVVTLYDSNSSTDIDTAYGQMGWWVDGVNQLNTQTFWFRVGATGPEALLGSLGHSITLYGTDQLNVTYHDSAQRFHALVEYNLTGGSMGSGHSDLAETITIHNDSDSVLEFTFFQFADFDLAGTAGDDSVAFMYKTNVVQWDGSQMSSETFSTNVGDGVMREAGSFSQLSGYMIDGSATNLSDSPLSYGPGDAAWLVQWTVSIGVGDSFIISKDKLITRHNIPSPDAGLLGVMGLAVSAVWRRRLA